MFEFCEEYRNVEQNFFERRKKKKRRKSSHAALRFVTQFFICRKLKKDFIDQKRDEKDVQRV